MAVAAKVEKSDIKCFLVSGRISGAMKSGHSWAQACVLVRDGRLVSVSICESIQIL